MGTRLLLLAGAASGFDPRLAAAASLNKHYEADSIALQFMSDAATGYPSPALLAGK